MNEREAVITLLQGGIVRWGRCEYRLLRRDDVEVRYDDGSPSDVVKVGYLLSTPSGKWREPEKEA